MLQQLSKLAEEEGDLESAARYQKQLNELAPSDDGASRLAQLYARYGELEEAQAVWSKMASGKSEAHRIFGAIDSLLGNKKPQPVLEITESMVRKDPHDWEALYRQGLALADLDKPDRGRAAVSGPARLDDRRRREERGRQGAQPRSQAQGRRRAGRRRSASQTVAAARGSRSAMVYQIRMACKLENRVICRRATGRPRSGRRPTSARRGWRPWAGCVSLAQKQGPAQGDEVIAQLPQGRARRRRPTSAPSGTGSICACCATTTPARSTPASAEPRRRRPIRWPSGPISIRSAAARAGWASGTYVGRGSEQKDNTPPLEKDELDHVLACFASLASPPARAGPGPDPSACLQGAEASQAGRRGRAVLSRVDRRRDAARRRSPACSAWRPSGAMSTA